jgi:hypothetical protein
MEYLKILAVIFVYEVVRWGANSNVEPVARKPLKTKTTSK